MLFEKYDIVVVGAGHAGCEAAHAAAQMGSKVMLVTMNMEAIARMSCNPAMGGVAKGQIVREIDALGGLSGIISDKSTIQFRMLNRSKGVAMWSPRSQNDRWLFSEYWRLALEQNPNVDFFQDSVTEVTLDSGKISGVKTAMGIEIPCKAVVLTNGTFLNGLIHVGRKNFGGGRMGEKASTGITAQLESLGFTSGRMKTGTPPRVDGRSINYSIMEEQPGDLNPSKFSYSSETQPIQHQKSCHITYTNSNVHDILRTGFEDSPMYNGSIQGLGPRYCPSIEDKINRFAERERHQIFVEPEGWNTIEVYVNGFSTSLPEDVQLKALHEIPGFEKAKIFRPGYAIEYDYFPPTQLNLTLETRGIENLYFAGQINGTTGYEEAACQGLVAGINAHQKLQGREPFIPLRNQAYIGVLIDDLVNKGTDEPYRMFTSRAEYRISLRQDNADERLTEIGYAMGLASLERMRALEHKRSQSRQVFDWANQAQVTPQDLNPILQQLGASEITEKQKVSRIILRPELDFEALQQIPAIRDQLSAYDPEAIEDAEIGMKYATYLEKEKENALKLKRLEQIKIRPDFDFHKLQSLSKEAREKLTNVKPATIAQASRISGVTPSDISVLLVYFGR
ncbi:MAG: tRNA uridine-5-carboxymethylaminomethyl(34) synthesis enzyme MnmG [Bacteroidetes bacterium]|nr:tRNA uridine-5-carboxymethylaminomethyl(34) synthesis enzyme MnmG [Bacteroidota bacterium]